MLCPYDGTDSRSDLLGLRGQADLEGGSMSNTKVTGWLIAYDIGGQPLLIVSSELNKPMAINAFEKAGFKVLEEKEVRRVCIVEHPGPIIVQQMKELNWIAKSKKLTEKKGILK